MRDSASEKNLHLALAGDRKGFFMNIFARRVPKAARAALLGCTLVSLIGVSGAHAATEPATQQACEDYLYSGQFESGITAIKARDKRAPAEQFCLGSLQFLNAISGLQHDLYRFGAGNQPVGRPGRGFFRMPVFRVPVPANTSPDPVSYQKIRDMLNRYVTRLQEAEKTLASIGDQPFKLSADLWRIRFDIDRNGKIDPRETLQALMQASGQFPRGMRRALQDPTKSLRVTFDTADAKWLQGYTNVLMSFGNFMLSFDFEKSYDASFHAIFGAEATAYGKKLKGLRGSQKEIAALQARIDQLKEAEAIAYTKQHRERRRVVNRELRAIQSENRRLRRNNQGHNQIDTSELRKELKELQQKSSEQWRLRRTGQKLRDQMARLDPLSGGSQTTRIASLIAFVHTINWPVIEPERLKATHGNLMKVLKLNHDTWRLVQAETDNDNEWLPNARQTGPFPGMRVTQQVIDQWLNTVKFGEKVMQGELLVPTLALGRGLNLKRFFHEAKRFDLVLFITGQNAVDFVEKGPIVNEAALRQLDNRAFGRNFGAYMIWFN